MMNATRAMRDDAAYSEIAAHLPAASPSLLCGTHACRRRYAPFRRNVRNATQRHHSGVATMTQCVVCQPSQPCRLYYALKNVILDKSNTRN